MQAVVQRVTSKRFIAMIVSMLVACTAILTARQAEARQYQYIPLEQAPIQRYASERDGVDRYFLESLMLSHQDVIASSEYVLQHSTDDSLKKTAQNIHTAHIEELEQMKVLYTTWYGEDPDQYIGNDSAGTVYPESWTDAEYINHIAAMHNASVDLAQMELMHTRRGQLAELCQQIIYMRTGEMQELKEYKN